MRSTKYAEQAFVTSLVGNTKKLVSNEAIELRTKLATLQNAIRKNSARISALKQSRASVTNEETRQRLDRFITLRERAVDYLSATAKWLAQSKKHSLILGGLPRTFATPSWNVQNQPKELVQTEAFPFMEYSS